MPAVKISEFHVAENSYDDGEGNRYRVKDLIEQAKDLKPFNIPLQGLYIGGNPWGKPTIKSFVYHVKRMNEADPQHPIILDTEGYVCDGWHRVCKSILAGQTTIKAVRLEVMPNAMKKDDNN